MANSQNVKMLLILPNNDQESFVNAINYNFHQLANIANGVVAKKGDKGDQGLPGLEGAPGEKGADGTRMYAYNSGESEDDYAKFISDNDVHEGDYLILTSGKIYEYDSSCKKIKDYEGKTPASDLSGAISEAVSEMVAGAASKLDTLIADKNSAVLYPKTLNEIDSKYTDEYSKISLPGLFTCSMSQTGDTSGVVKPAVDSNFYKYSISSFISDTLMGGPDEYKCYNIRFAGSNTLDAYSTIRQETSIEDSILRFGYFDKNSRRHKYIFETKHENAAGSVIIGNRGNDDDGTISSVCLCDNFGESLVGISANKTNSYIKTVNDIDIKSEKKVNIIAKSVYIKSSDDKNKQFYVTENNTYVGFSTSNCINLIKADYGTVPLPDGNNKKLQHDAVIIKTGLLKSSALYSLIESDNELRLNSDVSYIGKSHLGPYGSLSNNITFKGVRISIPKNDADTKSTICMKSRDLYISNMSDTRWLDRYILFTIGKASDSPILGSNYNKIGVSPDSDYAYAVSSSSLYVSSYNSITVHAGDKSSEYKQNLTLSATGKIIAKDSVCENYFASATRAAWFELKHDKVYNVDNKSGNFRVPSVENAEQFKTWVENNYSKDDSDRYYNYCSGSVKVIGGGYGSKTISSYPIDNTNYIDIYLNGVYSYGKCVIINISCLDTHYETLKDGTNVNYWFDIEGLIFLQKYNYYLQNGETKNNQLASAKGAFTDTSWFRNNRPGATWMNSASHAIDGKYEETGIFQINKDDGWKIYIKSMKCGNGSGKNNWKWRGELVILVP